MNKYLLMCAAASLAATAGSGVAAAATTVHFFGGGTNFCDYFVINNSGGGLYAAVHYGGVTCGPTSAQYDAGARDKKGKVPSGGSVQFADTTIAKADGLWDGLDFDLGTPFGAAKWAIIVNTNGVTAFVLNSGYQSTKVGPSSGKSTLSDAIKALRITKK
jgi:hypothetical protein